MEDSPYSALLARIVHGRWVGRLREMAEANMLWQRAVSGEGQVLLISGEPGVGKTRFARELSSVALADGGYVLTGECFAEGYAPYAPVAQMIGELFETTAQAGIDFSGALLADLAGLIPSLRLRFVDRIPAQTFDPQYARLRIVEGFVDLCAALCDRSPLLLFMDDVQWADTDNLFLLRNLARRSRKLPVLIVLTYREAQLEQAQQLQDFLLELNRERLAIQLKLLPLDRDETRDLLAAMFSTDADTEASTPIEEKFIDGIDSQTEGNPFFIEEVCKALIEAGQVSFRDEGWVYPDMAAVKIPQTVRAAIQARLKQLPDPAHEVLRMGAILGREFDFETLRRALLLGEESLIQVLENAVQAQIIAEVPASGSSAGWFRFAHILIPTTLRESIMHIRRRRYHLQAAQAIEVVHPDDFEALAYHYSEAGETDHAQDYYRLAGDRARQAAPVEAARFYRAALETWPERDPSGRADIIAQLGHILWLIGDIPGALKCFEDAHVLYDQVKNLTQSGEMQRMMGRMQWERADRALALQNYFQALAIQEQGPETPELARAISSISLMYMLAPNDDLGIAWGQRALAMAERLGVEDVVVEALNNIGTSYACAGEFDKGIDIIQDSLQRSLKAGLSLAACYAYYHTGSMRQRQCRYSEARETFQELLSYAGKVHAKNHVNLAFYRLAWVDWLTGQWTSALSNLSLIVPFTSSLYTTWVQRISGMIDLDVGRIEKGSSELEVGLPIALRAADMRTTITHLGQLVRAYGESGLETKVLETVCQMLEFVADTDHVSGEQIMPLFYACQQLAKKPEAYPVQEKQRCLAHLELLDQRYDTGEVHAALAEARGCLAAEASEAAEQFRQAAAEWESIGRPYDQARALASRGTALASVGELSNARLVLSQARQLFDTLAEQLDPERRAAFLDTLMVRATRHVMEEPPRNPTGRDMKSLTGREIEVLKLVAEGLTNAQIAERLVLSRLTVSAHLRSIFHKLDVTTRTAAARQASELGLV